MSGCKKNRALRISLDDQASPSQTNPYRGKKGVIREPKSVKVVGKTIKVKFNTGGSNKAGLAPGEDNKEAWVSFCNVMFDAILDGNPIR